MKGRLLQEKTPVQAKKLHPVEKSKSIEVQTRRQSQLEI